MHNPADFFRNNVPLALRKALLRAVFEGCSKAHHQAKARDGDFFLDAIPSFRRLEVESRLSKLLLPTGFKSEIFPTTSTHYTQIYSDTIVLTAVTRAKKVAGYVEPSLYRKTLARSSQLSLFRQDAEPEPDTGAKLYGLLVYGGAHKYVFPTIAEILFPTPSGHIVDDGVNLIAEHNDVVMRYAPPTEFQPAQPRLRKKSRTNED